MSLRESKGNMYTWVTHTWNTIKGICPHGCTYCYMKRFPQKELRFDESELKTDLGEGNFIFVGSSCDMFAYAIPEKWILDTLNHCELFYKNKYLFQTKNPQGIINYQNYFPEAVLCTTIETNRVYPGIMMNSPAPEIRAYGMHYLDEWERYVTIEPIMDFDLKEMVKYISWCNPKQVNIGADSGNNHLPEPPKEKILELIDALKEFTIIDQKRNLKRLLI